MTPTRWLAAGLMTVMAVVLIGVSREDSATVDEASHLGVGYLYWKGAHTRFGAEEHPPLESLIESFPLLFMQIKLSDTAQAMERGELGYPWTVSWAGQIKSVQQILEPGCQGQYVQIPPLGDRLVEWHCPSRYPLDNWYYQAVPEAQMFGKVFVYGGANDADAMLFAGRLGQILLTLLTGVVIVFWTHRATGQDSAAVIALAVWVFNPVALAYGHVANTDIGVAFGITLSAFLFSQLAEEPTVKYALMSGVATGLAMSMKYTTLLLAPTYLILSVMAWRRSNLSISNIGKLAAVFFIAGWCVALVVFWPFASPAPAPTQTDLTLFDVPGWFKTLRPLLVPSGLFKGLAIAMAHSKIGTDSYLMGQWSRGGWWYYFPLAFLFKTPVAYVILVVSGFLLFVPKVTTARLSEFVTWLGAGVYLFWTMSSGINIGVRHLLPMMSLLSVGIGCAFSRLTDRWLRCTTLGLIGWQAVVVLAAYPFYIQFFSEAVGGARNGYKYLIDSNYDWGQDARRLRNFLQDNGIDHIYLDYFGNQFSIEYLKIPNTRVNAETARQIRQGTLVVSASQLMRPEWNWLRESRQPLARVAYTLFVYQLP